MYFWNFFCTHRPQEPSSKDHLLIHLILPKGVDGNQVGSGGEGPGCLGLSLASVPLAAPRGPRHSQIALPQGCTRVTWGTPNHMSPQGQMRTGPLPCWQVGIMSGFYNMALTRPLSSLLFSNGKRGWHSCRTLQENQGGRSKCALMKCAEQVAQRCTPGFLEKVTETPAALLLSACPQGYCSKKPSLIFPATHYSPSWPSASSCVTGFGIGHSPASGPGGPLTPPAGARRLRLHFVHPATLGLNSGLNIPSPTDG